MHCQNDCRTPNMDDQYRSYTEQQAQHHEQQALASLYHQLTHPFALAPTSETYVSLGPTPDYNPVTASPTPPAFPNTDRQSSDSNWWTTSSYPPSAYCPCLCCPNDGTFQPFCHSSHDTLSFPAHGQSSSTASNTPFNRAGFSGYGLPAISQLIPEAKNVKEATNMCPACQPGIYCDYRISQSYNNDIQSREIRDTRLAHYGAVSDTGQASGQYIVHFLFGDC
jgi:hypothetical protein